MKRLIAAVFAVLSLTAATRLLGEKFHFTPLKVAVEPRSGG